MKKLLILLLLLPLAVHAQTEDKERDKILKIYNWADYLDMDLIEEFQEWYKEQTGEDIEIIYQTFDINENMLTEIEVGHEDYDVVCPSEYIVERMLRRNMLQKIDTTYFQQTGTPNWTHNVSPWVTDMFQRMAPDDAITVSDYTVGYMWGTTGILFNTAFVNEDEVQSWDAILNPRFQKQVFMKDAFRDIYSVLINYCRYDDILAGKVTRQQLFEDLSDENINAVRDLLIKAHPQIAGWETDFGKERMCQGKVWLNVTWSGDAAWAIDEEDEGVDLRYVVPKEGSNAWFDGWVIPIYARNVKAASYWIDFMCKEENAIRNMEEIGYVSVLGTPGILEEMQDEENDELDATYFFGPEATNVRLDPVFYPDLSVIERCGLMHDTADRNEAMLEMWARVKGDNLDWKMLGFIISVLSFLSAVILFRKLRVWRRRKMRRQRLREMNALA